MRFPPLLLLLAATAPLTAALTKPAHADALAACNARHKRPANPYGSVLTDGLRPALATPPAESSREGAKVSVAPGTSAAPPAKPQPVAGLAWRASFTPCGSGHG